MTIRPVCIDAPEGFRPPPALGRESRLGFVDLDRLFVDDSYQRPIDSAGRHLILRIAAKFDWALFGAFIVCPAGVGRYAIIDGQHRALAARLVGASKAPCVVIFGSPKQQARAFAAINGVVKPITLFNVYRAALASGEPWAVDAQAIVARGGCRLMDYNRASFERRPGEIYSIAYFRAMAENGGAASDRALSASGALAALMQGRDTSARPAAFAATPVQAWISVVYQVEGARHAPPARLSATLDACNFHGMIAAAAMQVAARRNGGDSTISLLEQLTCDLSDMLDAAFPRRRT